MSRLEGILAQACGLGLVTFMPACAASQPCGYDHASDAAQASGEFVGATLLLAPASAPAVGTGRPSKFSPIRSVVITDPRVLRALYKRTDEIRAHQWRPLEVNLGSPQLTLMMVRRNGKMRLVQVFEACELVFDAEMAAYPPDSTFMRLLRENLSPSFRELMVCVR